MCGLDLCECIPVFGMTSLKSFSSFYNSLILMSLVFLPKLKHRHDLDGWIGLMGWNHPLAVTLYPSSRARISSASRNEICPTGWPVSQVGPDIQSCRNINPNDQWSSDLSAEIPWGWHFFFLSNVAPQYDGLLWHLAGFLRFTFWTTLNFWPWIVTLWLYKIKKTQVVYTFVIFPLASEVVILFSWDK